MRWAAGMWLLALAYATVRYATFDATRAPEFPLYVLNKSLAFAAIGSFVASYFVHREETIRGLGQLGVGMALGHTALSLLLLATRSVTVLGRPSEPLAVHVQLGLVAGVIAMLALLWQHVHVGSSLVRMVRRAVLGAGAVHVALLGVPTWNALHPWHTGLPPITLVAGTVLVVTAVEAWRRGTTLLLHP